MSLCLDLPWDDHSAIYAIDLLTTEGTGFHWVRWKMLLDLLISTDIY